MRETRWNAIELRPPVIPYNVVTNYLDDSPRLTGNSKNVYITKSGSIAQRSGTTQYSSVLTNLHIAKMWLYESMPDSTDVVYSYLLLSVKDLSTNLYTLYYRSSDPSTTTALQDISLFSTIRDLAASTKPHLVTFSRGKAYIKSFPSTSEKLGTIILDLRNYPYVFPWGILGPTNPVHMSGKTVKLTAAATSTATTFSCTDNSALPSAPFVMWLGYEKVNVTAKPTSTSLTVTRGYDGTTAEKHDTGQVLLYYDWGASDHKIDVNLGWQYTFAYVSNTGQVSNRADIEYNPDLMPSNTGPFYDLVPKLTLTLDSWFYNDTSTYPHINIYRTTDGGGTFYFLEQVDNPGTSTLTYYDDSFGTGASSTTYNDPVPDSKLDTAHYAPSLTSNSPPTTVIPPQVIGEDTPSKACRAMVTFASRIWLAIDNYLFFSAREETRDGIGEECFPSGNLGNFFILDHAIVGMASTVDTLYIITTNNIYALTGSTLDTFVINKFVDDIGGMVMLDNCAISFKNKVAFFTKEGSIALIENNAVRVISRPPDIDLRTFQRATLNYYRDNDYEWLIVAGNTADQVSDDSVSLWYVYDLIRSEAERMDFWNTMWHTKCYSMLASNSSSANLAGIFCGHVITTGASTGYSVLSIMNPNAVTDLKITSGGTISTVGFERTAILNAMRCPVGDHLNVINRPMKDVAYYGALISFNSATSDHTAASNYFYYYRDNSFTANTYGPVTPLDPPRIDYATGSTNFKTYFYPTFSECYSVSPFISIPANDTTTILDIFSLAFVFDPAPKP